MTAAAPAVLRRLIPTADVPARVTHGDVLLEGTDLSVARGGRSILTGVDLTVRAGEVVALVGPNGAGKSTLLDVLTGDLPCTTGQVELCGRSLAAWSDQDMARRRAVLPQTITIGFPFTVEQVVRMGRSPWLRTPAADLDEMLVRSALADLELSHLAHRSFLALSGGEAARAALARVLAQDTQLLLLDEPTASLDIHHEELTLEVVRSAARRGAGVVVILHDLALAAAHADRVLLLDRGTVAADGSPADVLTPALLTETYRHPIEVLTHPRTGDPLVLVRR